MQQEALKNIKKPEPNTFQDEDLSMTKTQTIGESYALLSTEVKHTIKRHGNISNSLQYK
jgi:hypothetical protein